MVSLDSDLHVHVVEVKLVGYRNRKGWLLCFMQKRKMKLKRKERNLEIYEERNCLKRMEECCYECT